MNILVIYVILSIIWIFYRWKKEDFFHFPIGWTFFLLLGLTAYVLYIKYDSAYIECKTTKKYDIVTVKEITEEEKKYTTTLVGKTPITTSRNVNVDYIYVTLRDTQEVIKLPSRQSLEIKDGNNELLFKKCKNSFGRRYKYEIHN